MKSPNHYNRVLAIDPCTRGFGFAVVETRMRLVDWGVARVWGSSTKEFVARIECLIERYQPSGVVLEEVTGLRRSSRSSSRMQLLAEHLSKNRVTRAQISRAAVQTIFADTGRTKHDIARAVTGIFPELLPHLPPVRKPWMSEDERMPLFYAAALAITAVNISLGGRRGAG